MALRIEDALEVKSVTVDDPRGSYQSARYLFVCPCGKEMWKLKGALKTHTGKCVRCSKRGRHPLRTLYNGMLGSVKRTNARFGRNVEFRLSFEEFIFLSQIRQCAYCSGEVAWAEYGPGPYNLDRRDNSQGYEMGNLLVCCFECNHRKGKHWNSEEFTLIQRMITAYRNGTSEQKAEMAWGVTQWHDELTLGLTVMSEVSP